MPVHDVGHIVERTTEVEGIEWLRTIVAYQIGYIDREQAVVESRWSVTDAFDQCGQ